MKTNDNQRYIYFRATKEKIFVTQEEFDSFYNGVSLYRREQQRKNYCRCPKEERLSCDTNCEICRRRCDYNNTYSLDEPIRRKNGDHSEMNKFDLVPDYKTSPEDRIFMQEIIAHIREIMPEAITVGELRQDGQSYTKIAETLGIPRTTLMSQIEKLRKMLEAELSEIF